MTALENRLKLVEAEIISLKEERHRPSSRQLRFDDEDDISRIQTDTDHHRNTIITTPKSGGGRGSIEVDSDDIDDSVVAAEGPTDAMGSVVFRGEQEVGFFGG